MTGTHLIIIVSLVAMVIAYVGDVLGKRIGKKRISLFGLRPRHTAVVVTVCTGAIISIITFLVLISLSEQIRIMLTQTEEMQQQISDLKIERDNLTGETKELLNQVIMSQDHLASAEAEILKTGKEKEKLQGEMSQFSTHINQLAIDISDKESELDKLHENQLALEEQISDLGSKLVGTEDELDRLNDQLAETIRDREFIGKEIAHLETERNNRIAQIEKLNTDIASYEVELENLGQQIRRTGTETIAFHEGQRLYGFTLKNDLAISKILERVVSSTVDFNKADKEFNLDCKIRKLEPDMVYDNVIEKMKNSHAEESIVLVFSEMNVFRQDEIPVQFQVFDQFIVFSAGTVITEEVLVNKFDLFDARDTARSLLKTAEGKAIDRRLLQDPFGDVIKFAPISLNDIARKIVKTRRPVQVQLIAKKDIYRSDYLDEQNIEFRIISSE